MILKSSSKKMGIDWRLAYEELRRITQMMKMGLAKGKKKRGAAKGKCLCLAKYVQSPFMVRLFHSLYNRYYSSSLKPP